MTESPIPNKLAQWKRPLIGGLLSSLIAGFFVINYYRQTNMIIMLVGMVFLMPLMVFEGLFSAESAGLIVPIIMLLWFVPGALIAYYQQDNRKAARNWILLYIISFILFIVLYILLGYTTA